ncbi:hypothetical protein AAHA92_30260 [Salvia divinorum]|uniref:Uncharacterized protein n=1 Tax=Salvia divinorum TaxID=28513 RepID=A0ABD1G133_SALDI
MAASSLFTSKLLNLRNSPLDNLIRRHLLQSSAAAKNTLPFTSNQFLLKSGGAESQLIPSSAYSPSSMQFGAARSYAAKGDRRDDADSDSDDETDFDDDLESLSGSEFDDEDEYGDSDDE